MRKTYREFFAAERKVRACAKKAGLPNFRAAAIATKLTSHPLGHAHAAKLLTAALKRIIPQPVYAAWRQLASIAPTEIPPLGSIRVRALPGNVYGNCDRGRITLDPTSPMYRAAESGDLWPLMTLIHHEAWHMRNGSDERQAYAASLKFVQLHQPNNAPLLAEVRAAAAASLEKGRTS